MACDARCGFERTMARFRDPRNRLDEGGPPHRGTGLLDDDLVALAGAEGRPAFEAVEDEEAVGASAGRTAAHATARRGGTRRRLKESEGTAPRGRADEALERGLTVYVHV